MNNKLYILVRNDLSASQKAVQAGHALAQWCIDYPHTAEHEWKNGTLVYLRCGRMYLMGYEAIEAVSEDLTLAGCLVSEFREPYYDNKVTAVAIYGDKAQEMLKDFELL